MGLPLLLIGASGGSLLPKAGNWMNVVKVIFGFILLAIPLILLERMIDFKWIVLMSGILSLLFAAYLHNQYLQVEKANVKAGFWLAKILFLTFGLLMLFKPFIGEVQPTQSFESSENAGHFVMVESVEEIEKEIANASAQNKVVMLDLYADWCVACKEFEKYTFSDPTVKSLMSRMVLLQVDMTDNDEQDIEILEKYQVLGLPTIMFFDRQGSERVSNRVTGFVGPEDFATHLNNLL
ncbi:MAG: thioredoxin family protein [Gammaproteobacteria bacterium]|nr:thioredoxin family protein [Gammaproteobacteria bacterium]